MESIEDLLKKLDDVINDPRISLEEAETIESWFQERFNEDGTLAFSSFDLDAESVLGEE